MKTKPLLLALVCALSVFRTATAAPGVNIVQNGSFETFTGGGDSFPPWQFDAGYDAFINEPGQTAGGGVCVFVGYHMWQDLATVAGQSYQLSFYERGDDPGQTQRDSTLNVYWGGQLEGTYVDSNLVRGWNFHLFNVMATGPTTRLTFERAPGSYGLPGVDVVSAVPIPEPSVAALLAVVPGISLVTRTRFRAKQ
jgi:hypothetical protein